MKNKYVYKSKNCEEKMHLFYDKVLTGLSVEYEEKYIETSFGITHLLIVGDKKKKPIFTLHGGNGINPLNIKLFLPLLNDFCIYAPDVIGMPGKSYPYRMNPKNNDYGLWLNEVIEKIKKDKVTFVVSSYSSAMMLSLAKVHPEKIEKAVLLVPSGISHGNMLVIMQKQMLPFITYEIKPSKQKLKRTFEPMLTEEDEIWYELFDLILTTYEMELRSPREFNKKEMNNLKAPLFIIVAKQDIFFPPKQVLEKAKRIFNCSIKEMIIEGKHLPSENTMKNVCKEIKKFILVE